MSKVTHDCVVGCNLTDILQCLMTSSPFVCTRVTPPSLSLSLLFCLGRGVRSPPLCRNCFVPLRAVVDKSVQCEAWYCFEQCGILYTLQLLHPAYHAILPWGNYFIVDTTTALVVWTTISFSSPLSTF